MNTTLQKFLYWTPRIASILFILFISLFALDVFDGNQGFWETLFALFMHLIPSMLLAVGVALAWHWEWVGALMYGGFAVWYTLAGRGFNWTVYFLLAGIPFIIGAMFAIDWVIKQRALKAI